MKKIIYSLLTLPLVLLSACEVEMAAPRADSDDSSITLTALAVAGEKLSARVSRTQDPNKAVFDKYDDPYLMWRVLKFDQRNQQADIKQQEKYYDGNLITDAKVTALINNQTFSLVYNDSTLNYECVDYIIQPGDNIHLTAVSSIEQIDGTYREFTTYSEVTIPDKDFDIEILSTEKIYSKCTSNDGFNERNVDSVMIFKLKLKSSSGLNFYRLKVTSVEYIADYDKYLHDIQGNRYEYDETKVGLSFISPIDAFTCNDPLLYDSKIEKNFGPWQAYQTDVFTDKSFFDNEYVLDVSSRIATSRSDGMNYGRYFEIELQPITRELMEYLSTVYHIRVKEDSYFSQPITIPSNIKGGVGVFGAIGKSKKIRYFFPGEENPILAL